MMKMTLMFLMALGMAGAGVSAPANGGKALAPGLQEQQPTQESADADNLYDLVKQARADLREMRVASGLSAYTSGPQAGRRESRQGGEGTYLPKMTKQDKLFGNGARLVLEFDPATQVFVGSVTNSTARLLPQVRVEVHLDNGTELGPTRRIDVGPGETVPVELGAFGNEFSAWVSHPEAGVEDGHGAGGEEGGEGAGEHGGREGRGEHGGGETARPSGAAYRPVYNQLQILRGEMHAFRSDLAGSE
ncbi:MAG: hypothetical protein OXR82_20095 [Gammaproteobacteria bacterium]|nr:hypothetical protein [Gammaproteobacteria bacterium]MDE0260675.1 hypothetical protein [Gammaproteobacteria bacterium]